MESYFQQSNNSLFAVLVLKNLLKIDYLFILKLVAKIYIKCMVSACFQARCILKNRRTQA